jgi:hypothetical protein
LGFAHAARKFGKDPKFCDVVRNCTGPPLLKKTQPCGDAVSKAEEWAKAAECFELAKRVHDPEFRRRYQDIGFQWIALAEQIEGEAKRKR